MAEKKKSSNTGNIIAAAVIIALVIVGAFVVIYILKYDNPQNKNQQKTNNQDQSGIPKLVSTPSLTYTDNRTNANSPFLQITGIVQNVGNATANHCTINVNALQPGNVNAINISETLPYSSIIANGSEQINMDFHYTGQALETYTSYLSWTT